ncbi:response regulator [Candidatus Roizmanbacteria bacterium CG_4_10_14_0_8_um_filter_39_9]|uniref:Response regulator n=1 Tax=Candidatus Roizmanbacteria bacterium CG_4_10_14_0_8_um_filter_39_9 TaxID=1974829 RepID=A0A2M7QE21_9BACT|nr:MAG: response regulator [Candidatus Roizmanbacteria bacterium CG_4_10_14_0_8_um_filter_39_9]
MNILIAEDDTFFQKFYVNKLQELSFIVDLAIDGEEAIQKLTAKKYDCMLLDIIMPKKTGFDVLKYAKQNNILASTPIIVFSTLGQDADIKRALELGASDYANKAFFDFETLMAKINAVIQKKQTTV